MRTVNPQRIRRYLDRTLPKPPDTLHMSVADIEAMREWNNAWMRDRDPKGPEPAYFAWQKAVQDWARAQGRPVEWFYTPPLREASNIQEPAVATTISWRLRDKGAAA